MRATPHRRQRSEIGRKKTDVSMRTRFVSNDISSLLNTYECDDIDDLIQPHDIRLIGHEKDVSDDDRDGQQEEEEQRQSRLREISLVPNSQSSGIDDGEEGECNSLRSEDILRVRPHDRFVDQQHDGRDVEEQPVVRMEVQQDLEGQGGLQ